MLKKNIIVKHPVHFWPFSKAPAEKLMPQPQISFKTFIIKCGPWIVYFLLKSKLWWLEKVSFQSAWASPEPWTKLIVRQWEHFRPFFKVPDEKLMPHSQISFKSRLVNADSEWNFFLSKYMFWQLEIKILKQAPINFFSKPL